ncbi:penicillin-binding protein activator LpoB [Spartinivicinus poritis]|uniref:Penicillin-binding protein activator LpoB n=1 Tax=Spartinivicinus poritis TaxID=2994640 RepID=A0ABT5U3U6_9GAMM|nr:penicillin-binding protein activator LpoB [Spartinivicinus sp. A2-2]MDE1461048.1 penicillin-binding protein activator LpoB [Spartinivicinus sp. A2-2]
MKLIKKSVIAAVMALGLAGCNTTQVTRIGADEVVDLSGAWNDTDSQLVAREMINDSLSRPWITNFMARRGKTPAVIVGTVRNLSHEHINVRTFVAELERELINSGRVEFVASRTDRNEVREERMDQDLHASEDSRNAAGQERGADFMLQGQINTIFDVNDNKQVRYCQVDLTMVSMADNRKVWIGHKKIKKLVKNGKFRY